MTQKFVNLTGDAIFLRGADDDTADITLPAGDRVIRCPRYGEPAPTDSLGPHSAAVLSDWSEPLDLPAPQSGVCYLVPRATLAAARRAGRYDVAAPAEREPVEGGGWSVHGLILAGDPPPAYRLITGSATYSDTPRDLDILGYGPDDERSDAVHLAERPSIDGPEDYHENVPELRRGEWVIRVPVWGADDPSEPRLLWHAPCARPVRVVRDILQTGPAQIRRYAATGVRPVASALGLPDHDRDGHVGGLVVELRREDGDTVGYRGCGLQAWRRAAGRLALVQAAALPAHVREFLIAVLRCARPTFACASAADALRKVRADVPVERCERADGARGTPAQSDSITYFWCPRRLAWATPYGETTYRTFTDVLRVWT